MDLVLHRVPSLVIYDRKKEDGNFDLSRSDSDLESRTVHSGMSKLGTGVDFRR